MEHIQNIKQRFRIIGNDVSLNSALERAMQVAPTEITVLVIGESGVGKEYIPKIIHHLSPRKHYSYIAVNCGAIPEGTIDSELFGHEKGAFTGATGDRKGYFEVANKGTIFLDEVGELPLTTQVRLLRVLESGEFFKVGSSQIQKTDVRIVAATNSNMLESIQKNLFRKDLYYRLNTVQIDIPSLRARKSDIGLLFRKFSQYFAEKYNMPPIKLCQKAMSYIENYHWPGNIRQLRNLAEQLSVVEKQREITLSRIKESLPSLYPFTADSVLKNDFRTECDLLYKILFDLRKDLNDIKSLIMELMHIPGKKASIDRKGDTLYHFPSHDLNVSETKIFTHESLQEKEIKCIRKVLNRNNGKRKIAASELGISERTLYRKIKQYGL
ncbi:sigma-54-dependent transcriptional regulator [Candidatus Uzinura diaspidicola str. ASNER]|uniref:Sigma-54-dependent transcriptional regulator n=1 Tax=Candidatus Uzinura diaspidicola str. ASNER TaxID=1133592 RepID=L7VJX5_9FLAO|nr:sigma-54-dependent transcriptional regulator [Candidatus Uzinura diaspidicola str. ASNER]